MHKFIIIVTGPTGVGKSAFADILAEHLPVEIVNADMGQMYTPLSIGTAKPNLSEIKTPHHFFNSIDTPSVYTVTAFRKQVQQLINQIWQRGAIPLIVGGSTFYIHSLFFPPHQDEAIECAQMPEIADENLWAHLEAIDAERAQEIHEHDYYRLRRALAIWYGVGKKPSALKPIYTPIAPFLFVVVNREREELYKRIDERVTQMLQEGWLEEVAKLSTEWKEFLNEKKIIGYPDIIAFQKAQETMPVDDDALTAVIAQKTRNYAKRQMTFWRRLEKMLTKALKESEEKCSQVIECNLTNSPVDLYIKQLLTTITLMKEKC